MIWINLLLLLCNILLPIGFVLRHCISGGKIEFNHIFLFSVGYIVYWVSPFVIGECRLFQDVSGMGVWYGIFDRIPQTTIALYLLMSLSIYAAFCAGVLLCRRVRPGIRTDVQSFFFDRRFLNIFLALGVVAGSIYAFVLRGDFFQGYTAGDLGSNLGPRGTFIAISVFLLSLAILYSLKQQERRPGISFRSAISNYFSAIYFIIAILVLSMGGRLYFFSSILMLLVYRSVYFDKISYRAFFFFVLGALILSGVIGTLRLGAGVAVNDVLFSLVSEPLFNSFSLQQFLIDGRFEWVNFPIFLLGDFSNLIPSAVLPEKAIFLISPEDYGYHVFSPLGSLSSFFSFMINFGLLGTMFFMLVMAFCLQWLRNRGRNLLAKAVYIMVSGWLATAFYRDPFSISLVKDIFQYSLLLPTAVVVTASGVTFWLVRAPRQATVAKPSEI